MTDLTWQQVTSAPEWETATPEQRNTVQQKFFSSVVAPNVPDGIDPKDAWQQFSARTASSIAAPVRATGMRAALANTPLGMAADAVDPNSDSAGGNIVRGVGRGVLRGVRGIAMAGSALMPYGTPDAVKDAGFSALDKVKAAEDAIPQARSTGGRIAQGVGGFGAGLVTAGSGEAGARGQDLLDNGASLGDAEKGAAISGAAAVAGVATGGVNKLAFLPARIAAQAAAGGAITEGSRRLENAALPDDMHQDFDPVSFGVGVGGAAVAAFAPHGPAAKPLRHGDDLLSPGGNAIPGLEDPANHSMASQQARQGAARPVPVDADTGTNANGTTARAATPIESDLAAPHVNPDTRAMAQHTANVADLAEQHGFDAEQSAALTRNLAPQLARDPVTSFYNSDQLTPTLKAAADHVAATGQSARYAEIDVSNLGGLNAAIGHTKADSVLRDIAHSTHEELQAAGAQVEPFRRGGDEYGFVIIGGDHAKVQDALDNATERARQIAQEYGVENIPHPKGGMPGVGIYSAHEAITPGQSLETMHGNIDDAIESKKGVDANGNGTIGKNGLGQTDVGTSARKTPIIESGQVNSGEGAAGESGADVLGESSGEPAAAQAGEVTRNAQTAPAALPAGVDITPSGTRILVADSGNKNAATIRALGGRITVTPAGKRWALPAEQEPVLRASLAAQQIHGKPAGYSGMLDARDPLIPHARELAARLGRANVTPAAIRSIAVGVSDARVQNIIQHIDIKDNSGDNLTSNRESSGQIGQVQSAGMPSVSDAVAASDRAIADRTHAGVLHDFLLKVAPMAAGTHEAQALAKDFANTRRLARYEGVQADKAITSKFDHGQQVRMWKAADQTSVALQEGKPTHGIGLDTLTPAERAAVEHEQARANEAFEQAKAEGIIAGDALPSYVPRMIARITDAGAELFRTKGGARASADTRGNLKTRTAQLLGRKYLRTDETNAAAQGHDEHAQVIENIRTLPLATAKLQEAIAGRRLINRIKAIGAKAGTETVAEGRDPSKADQRWFTMPENPAFYTWRTKKENAPIREAFDEHLWNGLMKFAHDLGVDPQRVAKLRGKQWGNASTLGEVNTRFGGPESVLTHELGHQLDFKYGLADKFTRSGVSAKELRALADLRHEGMETTAGFKKYVREGSEKIANMVHAFVHTPERFRQVAPQTFRMFHDFLDAHPELEQLRKVKPSLVLGARTMDIPVTQWERVPIYVRGDFEGPLNAVLDEKEGAIYKGLMALKAKTMSVIMYSPLIHNAVEWGRALPAMPGKVVTFKVYFDGNRAKNDPATMREAINAGLSPIGGHGAYNDITSIANGPNLTPGRSWTAKLAAYVPGLFDKAAGDSVKRWVDKAGDVWHNTLLWDRVGDLQAGLYVGLRDKMLAKGIDARAAQITAAHLANRYAGTLPKEAMSSAAQKIANLTLFSRTFTLGNLGAMKDVITGLPKDSQAQILRDCGEQTLHGALSYAKRKALATVLLDIGLAKATNALLQSSIAILAGTAFGSDLDKLLGSAAAAAKKEAQGYVRRLNLEMQRVKENPMALFGALDAVSPTHDNEPGKQDRVLVGHAPDGTAIYVRNPVGKIGEEFQGWITHPLEQLKNKLSTFARPAYQTVANDKGFGQKVYDPYDQTSGANVRALGRIAALFISNQLPMQAIQGAADVLSGKGNATLNAARVLSPLAGVTVSQGAPGGEAVGEMYHARSEHEYGVQVGLPAIRDKIRAGDTAGAVRDMSALGIDPRLQEFYIASTLNPGARLSKTQLTAFMQYATPEERARMQEAMQKRAGN